MGYKNFIESVELNLDDKYFAISKIPAFTARRVYGELVTKIREYGEIGKTLLDEQTSRDILKFVAYKNDSGDFEAFETTTQIEKVLTDQKVFVTLLVKMMDYNFSFLTDGSLRELLGVPAEVEAESDL